MLITEKRDFYFLYLITELFSFRTFRRFCITNEKCKVWHSLLKTLRDNAIQQILKRCHFVQLTLIIILRCLRNLACLYQSIVKLVSLYVLLKIAEPIDDVTWSFTIQYARDYGYLRIEKICLDNDTDIHVKYATSNCKWCIS